ncbi:MAG: polyribonucleotide nucleotidyltransferase [Candidatus Omnitrophica bacterium]|nr:polyribonucleotide nucleotidyltransferase [Candidatus Omnitrophota bacterium]
MIERIQTGFGDSEIVLETGKLAKQAHGSVTVQCGGTMVLVTAVCSSEAKDSQGFFPLTVEYQEKTFAAGKIPGGFFKREGKPSEKAVLTSRMIDRPIRPLFPENMLNEVQVIATVLSIDDNYDPDILAINGASAALAISNIPFNGPIGAVRVAMIGGNFVANPTFGQMAETELDLVVVGTKRDVIMLEGGAHQLSEAKILDAIKFGHDNLKALIKLQEDFSARIGRTKRTDITYSDENKELFANIKKTYSDRVRKIFDIKLKEERKEAERKLRAEIVASEMTDDNGVTEGAVAQAIEKVEKELARNMIIKEKRRTDGRGYDDIRALSSEINLLPRTHGSALFTRGETQALAVTTLGTGADEQIIDGLEGDTRRSFMLHYNFPPFSVGEVKFLKGPGRREIGHGALAHKALSPVLPDPEIFPYTIRIVSEILESNGSSSMATVCAGSLSLMSGGVPIKAAVSGVAMGLIKEGNNYAVLTDIAGIEDHCGDMDFKIAGTKDGITAIQMDLKILGISFEILKDGLEKARQGRLKILTHMSTTIPEPLKDISATAPRIVSIKLPKDKIAEVIGPGGKVIKKIIADTGAEINIDDDGICEISSSDKSALDKAVNIVRGIISEPEIGTVYDATITKIMNFGAFCEFLPGKEGLIHVSELAEKYVKDPNEVVHEGDKVKVLLFEIDKQNRVNLSIKRVKDGNAKSPDKA